MTEDALLQLRGADSWTEDISGNVVTDENAPKKQFPTPNVGKPITSSAMMMMMQQQQREPRPTTAAKINQDRGGVAFPYGNCPKTALFAAYDGMYCLLACFQPYLRNGPELTPISFYCTTLRSPILYCRTRSGRRTGVAICLARSAVSPGKATGFSYQFGASLQGYLLGSG